LLSPFTSISKLLNFSILKEKILITPLLSPFTVISKLLNFSILNDKNNEK
jgi:hypothetical protein